MSDIDLAAIRERYQPTQGPDVSRVAAKMDVDALLAHIVTLEVHTVTLEQELDRAIRQRDYAAGVHEWLLQGKPTGLLPNVLPVVDQWEDMP